MKVRRSERLCRHCGERPEADASGLCAACGALPGVRELYAAGRGKAWERHLEVLARRARRRLPLGGVPLAETL